MSRLSQVIYYAWLHSAEICHLDNRNIFYRLKIFFDMLYCYWKYKMWTNQYVKDNFHLKSEEERKRLGLVFREEGKKRDAWQKDFRENRRFFIKYGNVKYEKASLRKKRDKAYTKRYHTGKNLFVEYDVNISRQHYLEGSISIGNNVLLAKHAFIDYSGEVIIHDYVTLANGVIIETHTHKLVGLGKDIPIPRKLEIFDNVHILACAYIADTCHSIGRMAIIGAGSYVRNNIPPYAIVMGNPAKIVGFKLTPKEIVEFEKTRYDEKDRIPLDLLEKNYKKYFLSRWKEIKQWCKL